MGRRETAADVGTSKPDADKLRKILRTICRGGALLLSIQPRNAIINDTNSELINVWCQIRENPNAVIRIIKEYDSKACDKARYLMMRNAYNDKIMRRELDATCAALFIWLNKHCFNGLYRVNSKGLFNVPYNNKERGESVDEENIRQIGQYLKQHDIEILNEDFESACKNVQPGDFVYFDPPYIPLSATANFTTYSKDGFSYKDQLRLAALAKKLDAAGAKVMLSNHDVGQVYELYDGFKIESIDVRRAINRDSTKRVGKEVIITNY